MPSIFAERLSGRPIMMLPSRAASILTAPECAFQLDFSPAPSSGLYVKNGRAVISLHGPLMHRQSPLDPFFGASSYEVVSEQLSEAILRSDVDEIHFDVDSPGGEVSGAFDLADEIANSPKPVYAHVSGMACSAAYLLIASAKEITASRVSHVGSIGVVMIHANVGKALAVEIREIASGNRKTEGSSFRSLDPAAEASMRGEVDAIAEMLFAHVAAHRAVSVDCVREMEARVYLGQDAVLSGLVDKIAAHGLDKGGRMSMAEMNAEIAPEEATEEVTEEVTELVTELVTEDVAEDAAEEATDTTEEETTSDPVELGISMERARIGRIDALTVRGHEALAAAAKAEGWDVARFLEEQTTAVQASNASSIAAMVSAPVTGNASIELPKRLDKTSTTEQIAMVWDRSAKVRDTYSSLDSFAALVRAQGVNL